MKNSLRKIKLPFMVSFIVFCATSCAFTVSDEKISPHFNGQSQPSLRPVSLLVDEFQDKREVEDPRKILSKRNAYGTTSGYIRTEKAAKDVLRDVIVDALSRSGVNLNRSQVKYKLSGSLTETRSEIRQGILAGTVTVIVSARMQLIDAETNEITWQDTIVGKGSKEAAFFGSKFLTELFKDALDDLSANLIHDGYFLQVITK